MQAHQAAHEVEGGGGRRTIADLETALQAAERERAALQQRLHALTVDLAAAQREIESYSYAVSHDLRAPLGAIDGFARIVLDLYGATMPDQARAFLGRIRQTCQRSAGMFDAILALSRVDRQRITAAELDTRELVRGLIEEMPADEPAVEWAIDPDISPVHGDPLLIRQLFGALLDNARKFTRGQPRPQVEVGSSSTLAGGRQAVWHVRDNGVGFDMQHAQRLFGVFQRIHHPDEFDGHGIGLALVRRIVERHGGRIWADATPGRGAAFYFTLPGSIAGSDGPR
jgi:signal transduction histidine kinase